MARTLTTEETSILADVVTDPVAWWDHCQSAFKGDPEDALASKLARWKPKHDERKAADDYRNRPERDSDDEAAEDAARIAKRAARPYGKVRHEAYGSVYAQLDMQYWDAVNGTTVWNDHVAAVKAAHPKA
jgi:hypothetical protein